MSGGLFETEDDTDVIDNTSGGLFANGEVGDAIASFEVAAEAAKDAAVAAQTAAETAETNAETAETNAATSATAAAGSATSAAASATTATTQASTATTKASEAATSASTATTQAGTATTKAGEAATSATSAAASATSATSSSTTATTKASEASASATTAATQATNAASSATGAASSASTASTHKTAAETAKTAAETAKTAAETAKTAAETAETNAETAETNAETAETNAASSAASASTSATNAAASATSASGSASTATTKANEASASATTASTQASTATTKASEASTSATNASNSATAAASSATTANTHKTAAETAKTAAETAETNAETAETNAETAETNAASSATAASTSATNSAASATSASGSASTATTQASTATTKASEASTSATNAATSATAAANSATAAAASATTATTQASTATTQASTATTKANTATTKASEASTSAASALSAQSAAESARDSALSAFDNFDDKYLGAKSSNPTVDNDGNALVAGALYFNTTDDLMKVYTGSAWGSAYASLSGALLVTNNLSDVNSAGTAATNIGLGTGNSPTFSGTTVNGNITVTGTVDGRDVAADGTKLDGVEANATADQTAAEIRALVESATDSNVFTDNDHTKLNSIESNATADQTAGEIEAIVNHDNLQGFVAAEHIDWSADQGSTNIHTGNYVNTTYSVGDGGLTQKNFTTALNTKLSNIEDNATADQTNAEIRAAVEAATDSNVFTDADHTKLNSIAASANNYSHPNHSGEVTSSGDGATTIADNVVDEANLKISNAPTNGYVLTARSGNTGGLTWEATASTGISNLVEDTTPQLGGDLASNGSDILFADSDKAIFGDGSDASIHWNGSSLEFSSEVGDMIIRGNNEVKLQAHTGENFFVGLSNGASTMYYDNSAKLATSSTGIDVTSNITFDGSSDEKVGAASSRTFLTGNLGSQLRAGNNTKVAATTTGVELTGATVQNGDFTFTGANYNAVWDSSDNALEFGDDAQLRFGAGTDLFIKSDGSNSIIQGAGTTYLRGSTVIISANGGSGGFETGIRVNEISSETSNVELYYDNSKTFETSSSGVSVIGSIAVSGTVDGRDIAADGTKLDGIASSANNYVHPNHSGEVTSSADGATVVADNVVDEANLKVSNSPTNGYVLTAQSGNTGGLTWAEAASGADLYAANPSSATDPTASGTNAIAIGDDAVASGVASVAFGQQTDATGTNAIAIGSGAQATQPHAVAIRATASARESTAIGVNNLANGAVAAGEGSMSLQGSYASGADSFAAAIATNSSSYGATGANSIAMGQNAKATGADSLAFGRTTQATTSYATAIGYNCLASGTYGVALGYQAQATGNNSIAAGASSTYAERANATAHGSVALGGAYANGVDSVAIGASAKSTQIGKISFSNDNFSAVGDSQGGQFILRADTTDATATVLTTNNSTAAATNQIVAVSDTCITFDGTITAMQDGAQAYASWRIEGLLVNDGGTTTLANSATTVIDNQSSWVMALSADNTNNALAITCTGEASHNIRWVANIRTTEVTYA